MSKVLNDALNKRLANDKQMVKDIAFLVKQVDTIEHEQDREGVAAIAKKYGIKRGWE